MELALYSNGRLLVVVVFMLAVAGLAAGQQADSSLHGYYRPVKFTPSVAIVIVVLVAAFFFLGFFSIYVRRCYGDRIDYAAANRLPRSRRQLGLDKAVLETFPTMAYADVKEHKGGALECAVCLSEFDDDETLRLLPRCSHVFHADCIDTWLASHVTCPVCRANLVVPDADVPASDDVPTVSPPPPTAAVVIDVEETEEERIIREETAELTRIGSRKRALRSKSGRTPARLPRSYSTGHSLAGAGDDRFTLRLPEHVLREVVAAGKLRRTTSLTAFPTGRHGSSTSRRGTRAGGDGGRSGTRLGQSGRWPSFLTRTFSAKLPAWGSRSIRRDEADGSNKGGKLAGAVAGAGA